MSEPKVMIQIELDDRGLKFNSTSKNMITILGLMVVAGYGFLTGNLKKEESSIIVPRFGNNGV